LLLSNSLLVVDSGSAKAVGQNLKNGHVYFDSKNTMHQALLLLHGQPLILLKINNIDELLEGILAGDVLPASVLNVGGQHFKRDQRCLFIRKRGWCLLFTNFSA